MVSRTRKMRGSRTHGRGKKHGRGHGDRGGTGMAGLHKHKFKWMLINAPEYFGVHGFIRHHDGLGKTLSINVEDVEARLTALVAQGAASAKGAGYDVDLGKAGFDKLLGGGRVHTALRVTVAAATDAARAKVKAAGGTVTTAKTDG